MRIVSNQRHITIHKALATATSLAGAILLFTSLVLPTLRPQAYLTPPLGLALLAVIIAAVGLNLSNYWLRAPVPHETLDQGLKGFGTQAVLYHYYLPAPHVLVCPQGVFSLTVKPQRVAVHVEGNTWTRTEKPLTRFTSALARADRLGNPGQLAERQAAKLQTWLDEHLPDHGTTVRPIVVFSNPEASLSVNEPAIPATYADKRKPSLKTTLRDLPKGTVLSPEQISTLEQAAGIPLPD